MDRKAEAFDLFDHRLDQRLQLLAKWRRKSDAEIEIGGNESKEHQLRRIVIRKTRRIEQVRHANLMNREVLPHCRDDFIAVDTDQRSWRSIATANGIDEDRGVEILKHWQQRQSERPPIEDGNALGDIEVARHLVGNERTEAIVPAKNVAESENEKLTVSRQEPPADR
jgi:hypothetical protein